MKLDEAAAAFGLFDVQYAYLTQQLAAAVFYIKRIKEPSLTFDKVFKQEFSKLRKSLLAELNQFDGRASTAFDVQCLRDTCATMIDLSTWRNNRAHPRVQIDEDGITVYDSRTRKQLTMNRDECVEKIQEATDITVTLDLRAGSLVRRLKSDEQWRKMLAEVWRTVDAENREPE